MGPPNTYSRYGMYNYSRPEISGSNGVVSKIISSRGEQIAGTNWYMVTNKKSNRPYYYNEKTGVTTLKLPISAVQSSKASTPKQPASKHPPSKHPPSNHSPSLQHSPSKHSPSKHSPSKHSPSKHSPSKHSPSKHSPSKRSPTIGNAMKSTAKKSQISKRIPNTQWWVIKDPISKKAYYHNDKTKKVTWECPPYLRAEAKKILKEWRPNYKCSLCSHAKFYNDRDCHQHIKEFHEHGSGAKCIKFPSISYLPDSPKEGQYECVHCSVKFAYGYQLGGHMKMHSELTKRRKRIGGRTYKPKDFATLMSRKRHRSNSAFDFSNNSTTHTSSDRITSPKHTSSSPHHASTHISTKAVSTSRKKRRKAKRSKKHRSKHLDGSKHFRERDDESGRRKGDIDSDLENRTPPSDNEQIEPLSPCKKSDYLLDVGSRNLNDFLHDFKRDIPDVKYNQVHEDLTPRMDWHFTQEARSTMSEFSKLESESGRDVFVGTTNSEEKKFTEEQHSDECKRCNLGGRLLICETCPDSYHVKCAGLRHAPWGEFQCDFCRQKRDTKRDIIEAESKTMLDFTEMDIDDMEGFKIYSFPAPSEEGQQSDKKEAE